MKFLLIALLGITTAFAQSEPVTRIKGDNDASFKIAPNLKVPYKQATKINSTTARIETGSSNMLPDPSFESGVLPSNTVPTTVGEYGISCEGSGSRGIETNVLANDGTKVLKLMYGAGIGLGVGRCGIYYKVPDNLIGTNVEISFTGAVKYGSTICIRTVQSISPFASQDGNCLTTNDGIADKNKSFVFSITPVYDVVYLYFSKPDGDNATGTYRQAFLDTIYIGKPKSDEAIVAKFDNTTNLESCGLTAADFQGFGTPTSINLDCARDGEFLHIIGSFLIGTSTSSEARINLKYRGQALQARSSAARALVGTFTFSTGSAVNEKGGSIYAKNNTSYITFDAKSVFSGASIVIGTDYSGVSVSYNNTPMIINARIPIAEWSSQTNAAIVACKEGPLKCSNVYTASVSSTGAVSRLNIPNWISCTVSSNVTTCNYFSGLYSVPPLCTLSSVRDGNNSMQHNYNTYTNTGFSVSFVNQAGTAQLGNFNISCTKTAPDYNESLEKFAGFLPMNDVKNTEWVVGYDWIDNKPIYKRCYKAIANIGVNGTTSLGSWPTGLSPMGPWGFLSGAWRIPLLAITSSNTSRDFAYNPTTGEISTTANTGNQILAGQKICMEYTR